MNEASYLPPVDGHDELMQMRLPGFKKKKEKDKDKKSVSHHSVLPKPQPRSPISTTVKIT